MKDWISILLATILLFVSVTEAQGQGRVYGVSTKFDVEELNTLVRKELGESLVNKGIMTVYEAIKITESPSFVIDLVRRYPYGQGEVLALQFENKKWRYYYKLNLLTFGVAVSKSNSKDVRPTYGRNNKKVKGFKVEETIHVSYDTEYYMQEFVYNGKIENSLKFLYREYISDNVRPSFTQEIQYDLDESKIIGFKGLRLEVVNVTNTQIEYKVLQSFN